MPILYGHLLWQSTVSVNEIGDIDKIFSLWYNANVSLDCQLEKQEIRSIKRAMKCPRCGALEDKVLDSRAAREGAAIRRRRECLSCAYRWTTYEEVDRDEVTVIKRDGKRQMFDRSKIDKAIRRACGKRPVTDEQIRSIIDKVVLGIEGEEVTADQVASLVMKELVKVDQVAYIRFASVYRQFTDVEQFLSAITEMMKK